MAHTIINPDGLHDPTGFGYSHVARTSGDLVFIAGQYASDGDGRASLALPAMLFEVDAIAVRRY